MAVSPIFSYHDSNSGKSRVREHDALKQTDAEIAAGVTPVNYAYAPGDIRRYGYTLGGDLVAALAAAVAVAVEGGPDVFIPEMGDYLDFATEINFPDSAFLTIRWDGRLRFTGTSGTAVSFGTYNTDRTDFLTVSGRGIWVEAQTTTWANGVTGVSFYGCFNSSVNVARITGFASGIRFRGDSTYATEYSDFHLGGAQILDNKVDINFDGVADNEINFYGGRLCQSASTHSGELSGSCGLFVAASNNNIRFYGTSLEAGATGIKEYKFLIRGLNVVLYGCRFEGAQTKAQGLLDTASVDCELNGGLLLDTPRGDNGIIDLGSRNRGFSSYFDWSAGEVTYRPTTGALASPTSGNWQRNDRVFCSAATYGRETYYICTTAGTFGTLNGGATTGSISSGSASLAVSSATGLARNGFITIAGVTGTKKVIDISGTTVTLDSTADATVAGAAVAFATPAFAACGHAWNTLPAAYTSNEGYITWNPANLADGAGETSPDVTLTGVTFSYTILVRPPYDLQGLVCTGYVQASGIVKIRIQNESGGAVDLASGVWYVRAINMFD
jgi:hypothetical protein